MPRKRVWLGAVVVVGVVASLAFTSFGGAAVRHVSQLIAPTANSAVADVNAFNNWGLNDCGSLCSRAGFKQVTSPFRGVYCLYSPTAVPDKSMLLLTADAQHSNSVPIALMWDRSSPNCGSSGYEVYTYCFNIIRPPPDEAPVRQAPVAPAPKEPEGPLCDDVAFYAEAFVR
jgi:hypothetical protein